MQFNREKLFKDLRKWEGPLSARQVAGINYILDAAELDRGLTRVEWLAYMLATTKHETADTYQPIHEYGGRAYFIKRYGSQTKVGKMLGNDTPEEGYIYSGEGDVQLTGENNYEKAENALREFYPEIVAEFQRRTGRKFDLTVGDQPDDHDDPKNAGDPAIAYAIMSFGMRTGMFTTKSLKTYTTADDFDELSARRIINGTDKAETIARHYRHWLAILTASFVKTSAAVPAVVPTDSDDAALLDPSGITPSNPQVEQPPTSIETITKKEAETPAGSESEVTKEKTFNTDTIKMVLPQANRARAWLGGGAIASFMASVSTKLAGMPDWMVFMLGFIAGMFAAGMIIITIQNRQMIGKVFMAALHINADPTTNNIDPVQQ